MREKLLITQQPTLSTSLPAASGRKRWGLDMTMTPSVSQSSDCLRRRSERPIPSLPWSSSMSRSWEVFLFTIMGPIFLRRWPSRYIGWTLGLSFVRLITDFIYGKHSEHLFLYPSWLKTPKKPQLVQLEQSSWCKRLTQSDFPSNKPECRGGQWNHTSCASCMLTSSLHHHIKV